MSKYKSGWMDFEEASYLSDLFQQIVTDCRVQLPLYEELVTRSSKLQSQLSSLLVVFNSFLETAEKICYQAVESKSDPELGLCLERIVSRHRNMELIMKTLTSILGDCLTTPIQSKLESWRKKVSVLDKEHSKSYKKMKGVVKKKSQAVEKLSKKVKKKAGDAELCEEHEVRLRELSITADVWVDKERAANVERSLLSTAAGGWKQIIGQEAAMLNQIQSLGEVMDKIDNKEDLYSERAKFDLERSFSVSITSPSGSPFTGKSRSESCKSRQSFSSRHSSVDTDCLLESERNHLSHHNLSQQPGSLAVETDLRRQSSLVTDNESLWLSSCYQDAPDEVLTVPVMSDISTPLSPLPASGDWRYRPCLPQRGCPSEPHYSVPRNNARVDTASLNEMDKTPTNEAGRILETLEKLDVRSESCSSGYDSNDVSALPMETPIK